RSTRNLAPMPVRRIIRPMTTPITSEADRLSDGGLYRMLTWFSPGFPIGAFSYSHGLETAAEHGIVHDRETLHRWIAAILTQGAGRMDADTLREAHRAAAAYDIAALTTVNRRGLAFRATSEMALETSAQGAAFLAACRAAWPEPFIDRWG